MRALNRRLLGVLAAAPLLGAPVTPALAQGAAAPASATPARPDPRDTSDEVLGAGSPAAPAPAPAPPTNPTPAALVPDVSETSKTAAATATPLSAARGGTLGFPAMGAPGVVAALRLQGGSGQTTKFDVLAQLGQIQLRSWLTLDVVVEKVSTDIPTATFTPGTGTPLPRLLQTDLTSVGFRLRAGSPGATDAQKRRLSQCLTAKRLLLPDALQIQRRDEAADSARVEAARKAGDPAELTKAEHNRALHAANDAANIANARRDASCPEFVPDDASVTSDADVFEAYQRYAEQSNAGWSLSLGARLLYRSQEIAGSAPGAAAEFTPQFGFRGGSAIFASQSFLWLSDSNTETDGIHSTTSSLYELKTTVGAYYKFNAPLKGVQTAPRVGAYASFGRNFWTNPYPVEGTDARIRGYQFEAGAFVSGHFSGGFNGLVQLGLRRSYGVDSNPEFFFTIVPSLGSNVGGGGT